MHRRVVQDEFTAQAAAWSTEPESADLQWLVQACELAPTDHALDVGAGTGLVSRALAPHVASVTAADLTPAMLAQVNDGTDAAIRPCCCAAESLPLRDASFDVVVSRWLVHHLADAAAVLAEMVRVCRPGGRVAIVDLVSDDDADIAARYNDLERARDPSHTRALAAAELRAALEAEGCDIATTRDWDRPVELADWLSFRPVDDAERDRIHGALHAELAGGAPTGMRPFLRDGALWFTHAMRMLVAVRRA